jgi:hypothetical protein
VPHVHPFAHIFKRDEDGAFEGKCCCALGSTWVNEDLQDYS